MKALRVSLTWLHTWLGILMAWVLYFMFLTGAIAYYDTEIDRWMQPDRPPPIEVTDAAASLERAIDFAANEAPDAVNWFVRVPLSRSYSPYNELYAREPKPGGGAATRYVEFDDEGQVIPPGRESFGGQGLYRMHYVFHYMPKRVGKWLAGIAALFMFGAILSGIVIHKKIFVDFFTLRLGKGQRSWLDAHNLSSVLTLPYQIMITYTGVVTNMVIYFPLIIAVQYGTDGAARISFAEEVYKRAPRIEASGTAASLHPVAPLVTEAQALYSDEVINGVTIAYPGDANARIAVSASIDGSIQRDMPQVVFEGVSGALIKYDPRAAMSPLAVNDVMEGLHEALFAGPTLRVLLFISALFGGAMVATGLVLWTSKRYQKLQTRADADFGLRLVDGINIGVIVGLPVGVAGYFWANRLLPIEMADRANWEMHCLFINWAALIVFGALRPKPSTWTYQFYIAAAAYGLLPVVNALTTERHLGQTMRLDADTGDLALMMIDLSFLAFGLVFSWLAIRMQRRAQPPINQSAYKTGAFAQ